MNGRDTSRSKLLQPQGQRRTRAAEMRGVVRDLAGFRYKLRKFLRFSESAARRCGVTPQQHQLLLGVAGFTGRGEATISELAEFMQERHNAVVGLVERAVQSGLVVKEHSERDRRVVSVSVTAQGEAVLAKLAELHREEVARVRTGILATAEVRPRSVAS